MATVHVGANADPHPSIILVPPEGWPVPTEGRRASSTPLRFSPIVPGDHTWRIGTPSRCPSRLKERPSASTVPMLMGYGAAGK